MAGISNNPRLLYPLPPYIYSPESRKGVRSIKRYLPSWNTKISTLQIIIVRGLLAKKSAKTELTPLRFTDKVVTILDPVSDITGTFLEIIGSVPDKSGTIPDKYCPISDKGGFIPNQVCTIWDKGDTAPDRIGTILDKVCSIPDRMGTI